jgi:hypothetical protein
MKKPRFPKINSIRFGLPWISTGVILGVVIPGVGYYVSGAFLWQLCVIGGVVLLAFGVVFAIEMWQDFGRTPYYLKKLAEDIPFDAETQYTVIKCSICTGEQVADFKSKTDGTFKEVMQIQSPKDLEYFKSIYHLDAVRKEY